MLSILPWPRLSLKVTTASLKLPNLNLHPKGQISNVKPLNPSTLTTRTRLDLNLKPLELGTSQIAKLRDPPQPAQMKLG